MAEEERVRYFLSAPCTCALADRRICWPNWVSGDLGAFFPPVLSWDCLTASHLSRSCEWRRDICNAIVGVHFWCCCELLCRLRDSWGQRLWFVCKPTVPRAASLGVCGGFWVSGCASSLHICWGPEKTNLSMFSVFCIQKEIIIFSSREIVFTVRWCISTSKAHNSPFIYYVGNAC